MCSGRVDPTFVLKAFAAGADGVLVCGCHPGDCHYIEGNYKTMRRFELLQELNRQLTIVLVTHDLGFVAGFVRTVICVHRRVDVHPTTELDGRLVSEIYGGEVRMVHHHHRLEP